MNRKPAEPVPSSPRRIMMIGYERANVIDIAGPLQLFASARGADGRPAYEVELVSAEPGAVLTTSGLVLQANRSIGQVTDADLDGLDTLLVSGGEGSRGAMHDKRLTDFIARASTHARRTASICTGAVLLAAAGLLKGRRATTHWAYAGTLAARFPDTDVDADAIYVRDGNIWSSAGVTAGMDLALALIEADLGRETALMLARHHVMYLMRPGGQSQFSAELAAQSAEDSRIARVCHHIAENPQAELSVPALAQIAAMSERSFARHFTQETGFTPAQFVERARVDAACRALSGEDANFDTIAATTGFGTGERMRRSFLRHLGVTPQRYRERFRTAERPMSHPLSQTSGDAHVQ